MSTKSKNPAARQYQNTVNNAQGRIFEDAILCGCAWYMRKGLAVVDKTPEPFRVMEKGRGGIFRGRFTSRAQPDFQGTLKNGRSIVFEAKYTATDRLRREVLTEKQTEALGLHHGLGVVAGVCAGIRDKCFFVPWPDWEHMKERFGRQYVTAEDLDPFRVRFNGAVLFLDYVKKSCGYIQK